MNHLEPDQNFKMADGIANCLVEGRPSGFIVDGELSLNVPIALAETDSEHLGEDDEDDEDDAENADDSEMTDEKNDQLYLASTTDQSTHASSHALAIHHPTKAYMEVSQRSLLHCINVSPGN